MKHESMTLLILFCLYLSTSVIVHGQADLEYLCWEQGGNWHPQSEECHRNMSFNVDINYPIEQTDPDIFIWITLEQYLEELTGDFFDSWTSGSGQPQFDAPWNMAVDYEIYHYPDDIVTVALQIEQSPGYRDEVPSTFTFMKTFTFNQPMSELIEWEDLFREDVEPIAAISPFVEAELLEVFGVIDDAPRIFGLTNSDNYTWFALTEDDLILFFSPWRMTADYIALEAEAIIEVHIPLTEIASIINPMFITTP